MLQIKILTIKKLANATKAVIMDKEGKKLHRQQLRETNENEKPLQDMEELRKENEELCANIKDNEEDFIFHMNKLETLQSQCPQYVDTILKKINFVKNKYE